MQPLSCLMKMGTRCPSKTLNLNAHCLRQRFVRAHRHNSAPNCRRFAQLIQAKLTNWRSVASIEYRVSASRGIVTAVLPYRTFNHVGLTATNSATKSA